MGAESDDEFRDFMRGRGNYAPGGSPTCRRLDITQAEVATRMGVTQ